MLISLSVLSLNLCSRYRRFNYNKIILMETNFGSSSAAEVLEIGIPLLGIFRRKRRKHKNNIVAIKRNVFYQCIYQRSGGRGFGDCLPALLTSSGLRTALIYWFIAYLIGFLSACLAFKCFYELAASWGLFHQLLACETGRNFSRQLLRFSRHLCMIAV